MNNNEPSQPFIATIQNKNAIEAQELVASAVRIKLLSIIIMLAAYITAFCSSLIYKNTPILSMIICVIILNTFDMLTWSKPQIALKKVFLNQAQDYDLTEAIIYLGRIIELLFMFYIFIIKILPGCIVFTVFDALICQFYLFLPLLIAAIAFLMINQSDKKLIKAAMLLGAEPDKIIIIKKT